MRFHDKTLWEGRWYSQWVLRSVSAMVLVAVLLLGFWWVMWRGENTQTAVPADARGLAQHEVLDVTGDRVSGASVDMASEQWGWGLDEAPLLADGRPQDVPLSAWAEMKASAGSATAPEAALADAVRFYRFERALQAWESLDGQMQADKKDALGQVLLDRLPAHVAQQDVPMSEALALCATLTATEASAGADVAQRLQRCQQQMAQHLPPAAQTKLQRERDCMTRWAQRQQELNAAFMQQPEQVRSQRRAQFEEELLAQRAALYQQLGCQGVF